LALSCIFANVSILHNNKLMLLIYLVWCYNSTYTGYPEHSEHFYIPDADSSVKLWANALNEVILLKFVNSQLLSYFLPVLFIACPTTRQCCCFCQGY